MHQLLNKTISLNIKITSRAESLEWDQVLELSGERDKILRQYFEQYPLSDENPVVLEIISELANTDKKIAELMATHKSQLVGEGLTLKRTYKAIKQYQSTQKQPLQVG